MADNKTYSEKLLDPRWQRKRLEILNRDNFTCLTCLSSNETLHVHHQYYEQGKDPWEYNNNTLYTLCKYCHEREPEFKEMQQFFIRAFQRKGFLNVDFDGWAESIDNSPLSKNNLFMLLGSLSNEAFCKELNTLINKHFQFFKDEPIRSNI